MAKQVMHSVGTPDERRQFIGGSDAAGILGVSPWRTQYRVWCEKAGIEAAPDLSDIDYIYFGHLLEPVCSQVFTERTPFKLRVDRKLYQHKQYPFLAGHVDRMIVGTKAFLECKSANAFDYRDWGAQGTDAEGVPEHYLCQVDHYMLVLGFDLCYVAVIIGGNEFRWYKVERDPKREKKLLDAELAFWELVTSNTPPPITNEADSKHRWRKVIQGASVPVDLACRKKIVKLSRVQSQLTELTKEKAALRDELFPLFQDLEYLSENGEVLCRLSEFKRNYFDADSMRAKYPKIAAKFTERRPSKRLKILI